MDIVSCTKGFASGTNGIVGTYNALCMPNNGHCCINKLKVENGLSSGQLFVTVKAVKGAYAYLHEYTTDASLAPGSWVTTNSTASRYTFNNLQPGTVYYCRVGAIGSNNQLLYSDAVSRMVI
jgi:hypothetical protein